MRLGLSLNRSLGARPSVLAAARVIRPISVRRRSVSAASYKEGDAYDEQQLFVPLDPTEMLGLTGRDSYHLCDIMDVYDDLRADAPTEGFGEEVLRGRLEVLELVKDRAVLQGGRVAPADRGGMVLPVQLLPSALVLLMQIGATDMVINMALPLLENWEVRKAYKRDILLALALAYCSKARDLLTNEQTVDGCLALEEALTMLQSGGSPPLAPRVAGEIEAALRGLAVPRVLDQLRAPAAPESAAARKRAVALLRHMLQSPEAYSAAPAGGRAGARAARQGAAAVTAVNADYVRLVVASMGARELVDMANWQAVARNTKANTWVYPGLLQIAAHAHAAVGFLERDPALIQTAAALQRAAPGVPSAESLVLRGASCVLLGATDEALGHLLAARRAPLDAVVPWPNEAALPYPADEDPVMATGMPVAQEAYGFVCAHSPDDGSGDLLQGLCLLSELWLSKIAFAMFPDTAADAANCSLSAYFNNTRVQQQLARGESGVAPAAAAVAGTLAAVAGGVQGGFGRAAAVVRKALAPAPAAAPAAAQGLMERGDGGGGNGWDSPRAPHRQQWEEDAQPYPEQWPPAGMARGAAYLDVAADVPEGPGRYADAWDEPLPRRAARSPGGEGVGYEQQAGDQEHAPAESEQWMRRPGAQRRQPQGALAQALERLEGLLPPGVAPAKAAAAAAGLLASVALAACAMQGRGAAAAAATAPAAAFTAASIAPVFDAAAATKLLRAFQEARWRALGPDYDASLLQSVAEGAALQHLRAQSNQYASRGWFQRFKLAGLRVTGVHPAGPGAARVEAAVRESSSMFGVDGRRGGEAASEYDVVYRVAAGSDGRWRVASFKVLGKEPGEGGLMGWLGR